MNGDYSVIVGREVRRLRRARNLTQERVAARMRSLGYAGWLRQVVGQVEQGKRRLTVDELPALSLALGVPVMDLLPEYPQPGGAQVTMPVTVTPAKFGPEFQRYVQQVVQEAVLRYGRGMP